MAKREWKKEPFVLFVEGYTDLLVYAEMCEYVEVDLKKLFIYDMGGKSSLETKIEDFLTPNKRKIITHFGIILDADDDFETSLRDFAEL